MENERENQEEPQELLLAFRDELLKLSEKSHDLFEKQLVFIASGSLAGCLLLVDKLIKDPPHSNYKVLLVIGLALIGLTLFINLLSHLHTASLHRKTVLEINSKSYDYALAVKRNKTISKINSISLAFLTTGLLLSFTYISTNFLSMSNTPKPTVQPDQRRGFPSSPPPAPAVLPRPQTGQPSSPPPQLPKR